MTEEDVRRIVREEIALVLRVTEVEIPKDGAERVQWIVNDSAELGVLIDGVPYFCYKGHSLIYETAVHDDGSPMWYRPIWRREFGECIRPINYSDRDKIGTVSLSDDTTWQLLPRVRIAE